MQIIKSTGNNQSAIVKQAVAVLKKGKTIVYPTETAYGLGADFLNKRAVKKVYQIKGRNFKKPLSVIVSTLAMAKKLVIFDKLALKLAKKHWPGPLTLVIASPKRAKQSQAVRLLRRATPRNDNKDQTLALRISSNKLATTIVKKLKSPLTATSANLSGQGEFYSVVEIIKQFAGKKYQPDLIIDAGKLPKVKPSTIVKIQDNQVEVLRKGSVVIASHALGGAKQSQSLLS